MGPRLMVLVFLEAGSVTWSSTAQVLHQKRGTVVMFFSFTLGPTWCYFYFCHILSIFFFYVWCRLRMLDTCFLFSLFSLKPVFTRLPKLHSSNHQKLFTEGLPKALWLEASAFILCPHCQDLCYQSPSAQLYTTSSV